MAITLLVTDRNLVPIGDPISGWDDITVTPQFNAAGSGVAVIPATPAVLDQVNASGSRMVVIRDGEYFMGGPIEEPSPFDWDADGAGGSGGSGDSSEPGLLAVSFTDDFALIASRITYPDPTLVATAQVLAYYTASSVNAETLLQTLVNLNAGPGALTARKVAKLVIGTTAGVGTNVDLSTRFEPLADVLRTVALAGGNLGFRTVQDAGQIVFTVYDPRDVSNQIRFSRGLGNLRKIRYASQAPTITAAIVGGDGTGASRTIRERLDSGAVSRWWRLEEFVNRGDTSDTAVMDQAGDEALATGGEQAQVSVVAIDNDAQRYGRDYALGDKVTVEIYPGLQVTEVVRAVTLHATPETGEVVSPLIGPDSAITDSRQLKQFAQLERRLGRVERS